MLKRMDSDASDVETLVRSWATRLIERDEYTLEQIRLDPPMGTRRSRQIAESSAGRHHTMGCSVENGTTAAVGAIAVPHNCVIETNGESPLATAEPNDSGMDCFADDREALNDFAKYFNNDHLSDINLHVGLIRFSAHKIVLCRSSDVFDRMLSRRWNNQPVSELKLSEEPACQSVFASFLRFLYCNHVVLNESNALPLLILADKYGVHGLKKVCVSFAISHVLPFANLKSLIHIWFKYATTAYHQDLINECVHKISQHFYHIIADDDWEDDWLSLDRDQLVELLKSSELSLPNEFVLWEAVERWFNAPNAGERRGANCSALLSQILPLIRFPFMSADELEAVEQSPLSQENHKLISPFTHLAFKFISMTLSSRAASPDFNGVQFLVRDYQDIRWDKRLSVAAEELQLRPAEHRFNITTRSSTFPLQQWDWELILCRNVNPYITASGFGGGVGSLVAARQQTDQFGIELKSVDLDQQRSVEYLLMITNETQILRTFAGKKTFTKSRTTASLELENRLNVSELMTGSLGDEKSLLHKGRLHLQLILRPIV